MRKLIKILNLSMVASLTVPARGILHCRRLARSGRRNHFNFGLWVVGCALHHGAGIVMEVAIGNNDLGPEFG